MLVAMIDILSVILFSPENMLPIHRQFTIRRRYYFSIVTLIISRLKKMKELMSVWTLKVTVLYIG